MHINHMLADHKQPNNIHRHDLSVLKHYPCKQTHDRDCVYCSNRANKRVRTLYKCHECDVYLCVNGDCFRMFHYKLSL